MKTLQRVLGVFALCLNLIACGGGDGNSDPVKPSPSGQTDEQRASSARLRLISDLENRRITLLWHDSFPVGATYRIERAVSADGPYSALESLPAGDAIESVMRWERTLTSSAAFRVLAVFPERTVALQTATGETVVVTTLPDIQPPEIIVNAVEPLAGTVKFALDSPQKFLSVQWLVDLAALGYGGNQAGHSFSWDTKSVENGEHSVIANIEIEPNSFLLARRTINEQNDDLITYARHVQSGPIDTVMFWVRVKDFRKIARVEASFGGGSTQTLTEPNYACRLCDEKETYQFIFDLDGFSSGMYTFHTKAIDLEGHSDQRDVPVEISNKPVLTIISPANGSVVSGDFTLSGTAESDKPEATVSTTASLGSLRFLTTTEHAFSSVFDLSTIKEGEYTVTVRSVDSDGDATVITRSIVVKNNIP